MSSCALLLICIGEAVRPDGVQLAIAVSGVRLVQVPVRIAESVGLRVGIVGYALEARGEALCVLS